MARSDAKSGRFTRREFIQTAAAVAASSAVARRAVADDERGKRREPPGQRDPDVVLVNGRIHTMDAQNSIVSSVAIKDGRFSDVGRHVDRGPRTRVIDLRGSTVVPGIIDNHNHIVLMGNRPGYHTPNERAEPAE